MPRDILKKANGDTAHAPAGVARLVSDPHDGSKKERWFVECQIRFYDKDDADAFYEYICEKYGLTSKDWDWRDP